MVKAGFDAFAHLRLRDHRPGNGDYELQPAFGPHSDSSKRSFLFKYPEPNNEHSSAVGPGSYTIPSCIGAGRSTRFAATSYVTQDAQGNAQSSGNLNKNKEMTEKSKNFTDNKEKNKSSEDNKVKNLSVISQYTMALCPQSPQYTLHGKLPSEWIVNPTGALGPGAYNVSESYEHVHNTTLGTSFGVKLNEHESNATTVPGPGTYRLRRFGDMSEDGNVNGNATSHCKHRNAPVVSFQQIRSELLEGHQRTPGPGSYSDPTTIAHRIGKRKVALVNTSTFGTRNDNGNNNTWYRRVPGPGAYNVEKGWEVTERNKRHAPRFRPPPILPNIHSSSKSLNVKRDTNISIKLPYELHLPSDFDYNYKKGKTMSSRWRLPLAAAANHSRNNQAIGPGSYNTEHDYCLSTRRAIPTCQFAAEPYEAQLIDIDASAKSEQYKSISNNASSNVDYYTVNYSAIMHRSPCALVMNGRERELDNKDGLPGPGHYNPEYKMLDVHANRATEFYKGDFTHHGGIVNAAECSALPKIGPGSYYNDHTVYSKSITGDLSSSSSSQRKGFTFGVRYPARALYQMCKPRDEFTNVNVTYDDERSWESPEIKMKE